MTITTISPVKLADHAYSSAPFVLIMTLQDFKLSLQQASPPKGISPLLMALWHDARGNWDKAHDLAQDVNTHDGSWLHAYLHRREGDRSNAQYWYHRANKKMPSCSLEQEWDELATDFLKNN